MSFFLDAIDYIIALRERGWGDEGFYEEYHWICCEVYNLKEMEHHS